MKTANATVAHQDNHGSKRPEPGLVQREAGPDPFGVTPARGACACGGGCPRCAGGGFVQAKLDVSQPGDRLEVEADRVAGSIMGGTAAGTVPAITSAPGAPVRRACACGGSSEEDCVCDDGADRPVQLKAAGAPRAPPDAADLTFGAGEAMPETLRADFEPRFGLSFDGVRLHHDAASARSARAFNAQAYTVGSDIVFGAGRYAPGTVTGRRLIAHELTHVVQQSRGGPSVQRMTLGVGTPPARFQQYNGRSVPAEEVERVNDAIAQVREVAHDSEAYPRCHGVFDDRCPNGTEDTYRIMFDKAVLWRADRTDDAHAFTWPNTSDIAYTEDGYDSGARQLAQTLVHELLHNCGITGEELHHLADVAGLYCIGPANQLTISAGPATGADYPWIMYSYRRLLADIGSGQLQLHAGADLNVMGLTTALLEPGAAVEYGSAMFGARLRGFHAPDLPPSEWPGGERFGGLTTSLELGASLGHFRVRDAPPEFGPGFVIQGGVGAEFYIPWGAQAVPLSVQAIYRLVQPLNPEAERMHGWLLSLGMNI